MNARSRLLILIASMGFAQLPAQSGNELVVAKDGTGQFTTIQDALNSIPSNNSKNVTIVIKNGLYPEKVFITKSHVALVGESRDSVRIVVAELRTNWTKVADNRHDGTLLDRDWGSAVVNIGDGVSDVTIANLTVHNNYGTLSGNHEHQFAIRGFHATRIALLDCNVIADGGDTVSLWNADSGMYYHANCSFEGWVDFVCPRGWCYITDSKFYGHNPTALIWHDGSADHSAKFVITHSSFGGSGSLALGRHHRDGQIYLLDCAFADAIMDLPIYSPKSPNLTPWKWGARHYFSGTKRSGTVFEWMKDNLQEAVGAPSRNVVTAQWTFDGRWDPINEIPSVLPGASMPLPEHDAIDQPAPSLKLRWTSGRRATAHRVRFGETDPPAFITQTTVTTFQRADLKPSTAYFWAVDEVTPAGIIPGRVWHFTTSSKDGVQ